MTAPVSPPQPSIAPPLTVGYLRRASVAVYLACEEPVAADISKHLKWAADRIEELKARAEQAEQAVDVLESNAREQAKLLADTGRRVEDLEAALLAAREYVAGASLAAGTPAYIKCCELLIKIDAALPPSTPAVSR